MHELLGESSRSDLTEIPSSLAQATHSPFTSGSTSPRLRPTDSKMDRFTKGLTKRELSDMAMGVRELSKRLGSARLKLRVKNILIVTKPCDQELVDKTLEVTLFLMQLAGKKEPYVVHVEETMRNAHNFPTEELVAKYPKRLKFWTAEQLTKQSSQYDFCDYFGWRWNCAVYIMVVSACCAACAFLCSWVVGVLNAV